MGADQTFASLFESFYTRHILRDLMAKIAPGFLLICGFRTITSSAHQALTDMHKANLGTWLVFGSIAWLTGLAVQGIGELTGPCRHLPIQNCIRPKGKPRIEAQLAFQNKLCSIDRDPDVTACNRQHLERLAVIKEAAGNASMAIAFLIAAVIWSNLVHWSDTVAVLVVLTALWIGLWRMHIENVRRQDDYISILTAKRISRRPGRTPMMARTRRDRKSM